MIIWFWSPQIQQRMKVLQTTHNCSCIFLQLKIRLMGSPFFLAMFLLWWTLWSRKLVKKEFIWDFREWDFIMVKKKKKQAADMVVWTENEDSHHKMHYVYECVSCECHEWNYRWLRTTTWVHGNKSASSKISTKALNTELSVNPKQISFKIFIFHSLCYYAFLSLILPSKHSLSSSQFYSFLPSHPLLFSFFPLLFFRYSFLLPCFLFLSILFFFRIFSTSSGL